MLYLNPPYHVVDGITVLPDHADPRQFYYMPTAPRLVRERGDEGEPGAPRLSLLKYRSRREEGGGLLDFDVHLGVDDDILDEVAREIQSRERMRERPRLAPVPLVDGTVKLLMLGRSSDDEPDEEGEPATPDLFELKFAHHASPALYGDNRAAFSVQLDREAVTVVEEALQGETAPIGVVYSLDFWGLRPAYHVRLSIDWERVQEHFQESFGADTIVFSSQIDEIVDELVEDRTIVLEADTFVPEGDEFGSVTERRDRALAQVREMITEEFFEPTLDPIREEDPSDLDEFVDATESLATIHATGGLSGVASFSYQKTDIERRDRKSLDVNMRERTTVQRSIYPQGHLDGLFRPVHEEGLELDRFVRSVDLDDPWFDERRVRVIARADFEKDSIASIHAELDYRSTPRSALLEPDAPERTVEWSSVVDRGGQMMRSLSARYRVTFEDVEGSERPRVIESEPKTVETDVLEIDPRELYAIRDVPVMALDFPWESYPMVEVHLRYHDLENEIRMQDVIMLDEENPEATWPMFVRDPERTDFEVRLVYRSADHRDVEGEWRTEDAQRVVVRDPFPTKRTVDVVPALSWDEVNQVFVDLSYHDPDNDVREERSMRFDRDDPTADPFVVDLVDPERRLVEYRVTIIFADGRVVEVPPSRTRESRILVRSDMKGHRVVRVRPSDDADFGDGLDEMVVEIRYEDEEGGLRFSDEYRFADPADDHFFEYDYVDDDRDEFRYRVKYRFDNGLSRSVDWTTVDGDELVVPAS